MTGAPYAPFMEPRTTRPPGLSPLDPADWIAFDPDYAAQMAERDRLIAERSDRVLASTPEAAEPLRELRETVLAALAQRREWRIGAEAVTRRGDTRRVGVVRRRHERPHRVPPVPPHVRP